VGGAARLPVVVCEYELENSTCTSSTGTVWTARDAVGADGPPGAAQQASPAEAQERPEAVSLFVSTDDPHSR